MATRNTLNQNILDGLYEFAFEAYTAEPQVYPQLFEVKNSTKAYEFGTDFSLQSQVTEVEEEEEGAASKAIENFTWYHKMRKLQAHIDVSKEAVDDGRLSLNEWGAELGKGFSYAEERLAARIFNKGAMAAGDYVFNTQVAGVLSDQFGNLIYDSKAFFATDHPDKQATAATYANYTASRTLSESNLETTINTFENTNAKDNMGNEVVIKADTLVVPPGLQFTAAKILNSTLLPAVATNDINPLRGRLNPVVWRFLDDADGWFIGTAKNGITWWNRSPLEISQTFIPGKDIYRIFLSKRIGLGVKNWRYWYACNIASS